MVHGDEGDDGDEDEDGDRVADQALTKGKDSNWNIKMKPVAVPDKWCSKHETVFEKRKQSRKTQDTLDPQTTIDFGQIDDEGNFAKKVRINVCGKSIWKHPSQQTMARGGWLQYSVIAKDSRFEDAISLRSKWQEFRELSTLAICQYFPSTT